MAIKCHAFLKGEDAARDEVLGMGGAVCPHIFGTFQYHDWQSGYRSKLAEISRLIIPH